MGCKADWAGTIAGHHALMLLEEVPYDLAAEHILTLTELDLEMEVARLLVPGLYITIIPGSADPCDDEA